MAFAVTINFANGRKRHFLSTIPRIPLLALQIPRSPLRKLKTLFKLWRHQHDGYAIPGVACDIDYPHNVPNVQAALTLHINNSVGASAEFRPESGAQVTLETGLEFRRSSGSLEEGVPLFGHCTVRMIRPSTSAMSVAGSAMRTSRPTE
jgi:hypothetical protein